MENEYWYVSEEWIKKISDRLSVTPLTRIKDHLKKWYIQIFTYGHHQPKKFDPIESFDFKDNQKMAEAVIELYNNKDFSKFNSMLLDIDTIIRDNFIINLERLVGIKKQKKSNTDLWNETRK